MQIATRKLLAVAALAGLVFAAPATRAQEIAPDSLVKYVTLEG